MQKSKATISQIATLSLHRATLALDISNDVLVKSAVLHAHVRGEGGVGHPLGGSTGSGLLHHAVDLLKRQTLGLGDEEEGVDEGESAETTPDEEDG